METKLFGTFLLVGNAELQNVKGVYLCLYDNTLVNKMCVFMVKCMGKTYVVGVAMYFSFSAFSLPSNFLFPFPFGFRSMLAHDLQLIFIYDLEGKFSGVWWSGSKLPIEIDGTRIVIVDAIGSSGIDLKLMTQNNFRTEQYRIFFDYLFLFVLELKMLLSETDPGVPIYAGFGALMLTTCINCLS